MELIPISSQKLKVTMSAADLAQYSLSCDALDYENAATRRAVRTLLADVNTRCGFETAPDRVFVQVYPARGGGCELYITRLNDAAEEPSDPIPSPTELPPRSDPAEQAEADGQASFVCIYAFPTMRQLLCGCAALAAAGYQWESRAYEDEERTRYFLTLREEVAGSAEAFTLPSATGAVRQPVGSAFAYIGEHCTCLCETDAVTTLAKFA